MTMIERVRAMPRTSKPMTRWRWHRCKCAQCGVFHTDLVPHYETVVRPKRGEPFCRVECDRCLFGRVPLATYDMYVSMRMALVDSLGLKRE